MKRIFFCFSFIILLSSCDPLFDINIYVSNQSNENITIIIPRDTFLIVSDSETLIKNYSGVGESTNEAYENLDSIPLDYIIIQQGNKTYNKNPKDKSNWTWQDWEAKVGGITTLMVHEEDLD